MSVYVDPLMQHGWKLRGHVVKSCHLYADTLDELHTMAERIGLKRKWFQEHPFLPHYDLTAVRRLAALRAGAKEASRHEMVAVLRARRLSIRRGQPQYPEP